MPNCPRCNVPLAEIEYEGVKIDTCPECEGEWLDRDELKKVVARREEVFSPEEMQQVEASVRQAEAAPLEEDRPEAQCPRCNMPLQTFKYAATTGVAIDRCAECGGVWLDKDELEQVQMLAEQWEQHLESDKAKYGQVLARVRQEQAGMDAVSVSRFRFMNALMTGLLRVFD